MNNPFTLWTKPIITWADAGTDYTEIRWGCRRKWGCRSRGLFHIVYVNQEMRDYERAAKKACLSIWDMDKSKWRYYTIK